VCAVGDGCSTVVELCGRGERGGDVTESLGDFEDFGAVDATGVLVRCVCALGYVAGGVV
jgi:hypothetical protein